MPYLIRSASSNDSADLAVLLEAYLPETYASEWGGSAENLAEHLAEGSVEIAVAENEAQQVIGLIAFIFTYDLHWCMKGADIIDFYVFRFHRGKGAAIRLVTWLAEKVQERGGSFIKGGAVDDPIIRKLYQKVAACQPNGEAYISGRAFRHLAGLSGKSVREIIKSLPKTEWNSEP